jgi:2-C-methyl-D-erythritol 2,4-cyclodiphosphate synthase
MKRVTDAGYVVGNVDSTLILAKPKIGPHAAEIRTNVARMLSIDPSAVGVKAKTPEGMGTDDAAIAHVTVLLLRKDSALPEVTSVAEAVPQPEVDEVVEKVLKDVPAKPSRRKPVHKH